jgi:hypothetical protein
MHSYLNITAIKYAALWRNVEMLFTKPHKSGYFMFFMMYF